jgi:hypothetical protein
MILTKICTTDITKKCVFTVNYLMLYVLKEFRCKLHKDGDNAKHKEAY